MTLGTITHDIAIWDGVVGAPATEHGTVINLTGSVYDANHYGICLAADAFKIAPELAELLGDPLTAGSISPQPVRAIAHRNREIRFPLNIKAGNQQDLQDYVNQLAVIAERCRLWITDGYGGQPMLKIRPARVGHAQYYNILAMDVMEPETYGGVEMVGNFMRSVMVRCVCSPNPDGYPKPAWVPNAWTSGLYRVDGRTTYGADLKSGNYLTARWNPGSWLGLSASKGAVLVWFRYEWDNGTDANTRVIFTTDDGGAASPLVGISKTSAGILEAKIYSGGAYKTVTISQATLNGLIGSTKTYERYGVMLEWGRSGVGLQAYLFSEGTTPADPATSCFVSTFTGANAGYTGALDATPTYFRIGADTSGSNPLNCEVDSPMIFEQAGFEIPGYVYFLPFTNDAGSIQIQRGHTITNKFNPTSVADGELQTTFRTPSGTLPGRLAVRVRGVNHDIKRLTMWATRGRIAMSDIPPLFVHSSGATVNSGDAWSSAASSESWIGSAVRKNSGSNVTAAASAAAFTQNVTISDVVANNAAHLYPGAYMVYIRATADTSANAEFKVSITAGSASVSTDVVTFTTPFDNSNYRLIKAGVLNLPYDIVPLPPRGMSSRSVIITVGIHASWAGTGNTTIDGVLFVPIQQSFPALALQLNTKLLYSGGTAAQIETMAEARPPVFRAYQTTGTAQALDSLVIGDAPTLAPLSDTRLWLTFDKANASSESNYPISDIASQVTVDAWYTPRDRNVS